MADETAGTTTNGNGTAATDPRTCLVTGGSGYIGGRLVPELLDAGYRVRCLVRTPRKLRDQPWAGRVEVVPGDVADAGSVAAAMEGVRAAERAQKRGTASRPSDAGGPGGPSEPAPAAPSAPRELP